MLKKAPNFVDTIQLFFIKGLSMYFCVTITTLPLLVKMFGMLPTYAILGNLFFLPILTMAFCISLVALVTWVGQIFLYPIEHALRVLNILLGKIADARGSVIYLNNGGAFFLAYLVALFLMSRFVFVRPIYKYATAILFFCIYAVGFFV